MLDPAQTVQIFEEMDRLLAERWQRIKELEASLSTAQGKLSAADQAWHEQEDELQSLRSGLEVVSKEVEAMEALLEKATNDVSAWRTRATSAENRLDEAVREREIYKKLHAVSGDQRDQAMEGLNAALKLMREIHDDLLDRADIDRRDGTKVVHLSSSRWNRLCEFVVERQK